MVDDESMNNNERASQLAVAVGMLLFASVIFGSGVLGDSGEDRLTDENDRGEETESNPNSDRPEMAPDDRDVDLDSMSWEDCMGDEMPRQPLTDQRPNMPTDRPDSTVLEDMTPEDRERLAASGIGIDRTEDRDPCMGMFRGEGPDMMGMNGMFGPNQELHSMFFQMCQAWVHSEFWGNIDNMERAEDGSVSITTYAADGTTSTDTLSPESVRAMNAALAPLVDGCVAMMGSMLMNSGIGIPDGHHGGNMHPDWRDCEDGDWNHWDDEWDENYNWEEESEDDSNSDEDGWGDEPRTRDSEQNDRRDFNQDPCEEQDWDNDWDENDWNQEDEDYFWEAYWDDETGTYNEHWSSEEGEFWLSENYESCWGILEWVDPDGNEVYEEWELDECGDSEEQHEDESDEESHEGNETDEEDESDEEEDTPCNTPDCEGSN